MQICSVTRLARINSIVQNTRISHTAHCFKIVQQAASWKTSHAQKQTTQNTNQLLKQRRLNYKLETGPHFSHCTLFLQ